MELTRQQVEAFAAGLYEVARSDGIHESEIKLIEEFLHEASAEDLSGRLGEIGFDPVEAYAIFGSSWLRTVFLKSALLLIQADHQVTEPEREIIDWIAGVFGVYGGYDVLVESLQGESLGG